MDLDQEHPPALLHQFAGRRTASHLHAAFGIDIHAGQAASIQDFLNRYHRLRLVLHGERLVERSPFILLQRFANDFERIRDPLGLSLERLRLDPSFKDGQGISSESDGRGGRCQPAGSAGEEAFHGGSPRKGNQICR